MAKKISVGIDLGGTNIRAAIVDENGAVLVREKMKTPREGGAQRIIHSIVSIMHAVLRLSKNSSKDIDGMGIGMPGPLNSETGQIAFMPNVSGFDSYPARREIEKQSGVRTVILNDADAAAIGEHRCGAAKGKNRFVMLTLGTGLGSSIVIGGKPWAGQDGYSTEMGHIPIFNSEDMCSCRKRAHSESRLSIQGLFTDYSNQKGSHLQKQSFTVQSLFELARKGDPVASGVVERYAEALGRVICVAAIMLNIRFFVVGGGISSSFDILKHTVYQVIDKYGFPPLTDNIVIRKSYLENDAAVIGAGLFVLTDS